MNVSVDWLRLSVPALALVALLGCSEEQSSGPAATTATGAAVQQAAKVYEVYDGITKPVDGPPTITLAHYERIKDGMTYRQAVRVIGAEADIITDDAIGSTGALRRVAKWVNGDRSQATLTFLNARLMSKEQTDLK